MLYLLDTANVETIRRLVEIYPIDGVTTNPSILSREPGAPAEQLRAIRAAIGPDRMLHAQVIGKEADGMLQEALALRDAIGGNLYIKIPAVPQSLKALPAMKKAGLNVTVTAVFSSAQALLFARAGADYLAPFVSRLDNITSDGVGTVAEMMQTLSQYDLNAQVLAASFRTADQIRRLAMLGVPAATIAPAILETLIWHPMTDDALSKFDADWKKLTGGSDDWTKLL